MPEVHVQDKAKWQGLGEPNAKWLLDDVAKVGEVQVFSPNITLASDEIKKFTGGIEKSIKHVEGATYDFVCEIVGGFGSGERAFFIADCSFPIKICVRRGVRRFGGPLKLSKKDDALCFKRGDFIGFRGILKSSHFCEDCISVGMTARIKSRKKINIKSENDFDLLLEVEYLQFHEPEINEPAGPFLDCRVM